MPRIRTIKPTFWDDDRVNNTPLPALLFYIGLKNFCDDKGIISANDKLIKAKVFPQRDDVRLKDVCQWLNDLEENSLLVRLSYNGKAYYALDFSEEKIDRPAPSILPDDALQNCSRIFLPPPPDSRALANDLTVLGEERKGIGKDIGAPAVPPPEPVIPEKKEEKKEAKPENSEAVKAYFVLLAGNPKKQRYWPEDKCHNEACKFFDHYEANGWVQGTGKKPIKDWKAAVRNWLRNELEGVFGAKSGHGPPPKPPVLPPPSQPPDKLATELNYLYGRYLENQCTVISIETIHYDYLKKKGIINFPAETVAAIRNQAIAEKPEAAADEHVRNRLMKKFGVLEFFAGMKQKGKEDLHGTVD